MSAAPDAVPPVPVPATTSAAHKRRRTEHEYCLDPVETALPSLSPSPLPSPSPSPSPSSSPSPDNTNNNEPQLPEQQEQHFETKQHHHCHNPHSHHHDKCPDEMPPPSNTSRGRLRAMLLAAAAATADPPAPDGDSTALREAIRAVQADESDDNDRARRIHQLFMERREKAMKTVGAAVAIEPKGLFPGKGAPRGCEHYERKCWIRAKCCAKYYACRRCHDEKEDHEMNRHATEQVACVECGESDQEVSNECRRCHVQFARYFCAVCKFYDDSEGKEAYHCDGCGICRVGKGLGIDNHHCNGCSSCVPIEAKDSHPCRERSLDANCPICAHYLATSTEPVVFMLCGHTMHVECLTQHTASRYTCPICNKCLTDMKDWYKQMDERIAQDVMPAEYARRMSRVLCHDCGEKTVVPFHFAYHKCGDCGAYNTRVLEQFDREDGDEDGDGDRDGGASGLSTPSAAMAAATAAAASAGRRIVDAGGGTGIVGGQAVVGVRGLVGGGTNGGGRLGVVATGGNGIGLEERR